MGYRTLRIAFVDHRANVGGGRRFTSSLSRAIREAFPACDIKLVITREAKDQRWFGDLGSIPVDVVGLVTEQTTRQWLPDGRSWGLPGTWRMKEAARRLLLNTRFRFDKQMERALQNVDLAYFAWPYFIEYRDLGIPVVCTIHDLIWKYVDGSMPSENQTLENQIPLWLARSDAVVTGTTFMRQEIERFYPGTAKRIQVVPLPASDLPAPLQGQECEAFLDRSNIHKAFAFCPAGLWVHKNHENLIRAFARLKKSGSNVILVCSGTYTDQALGVAPPAQMWPRARLLRDMTLGLGLTPGKDVIGLGHVSDVELATLYAAAHCLVMPVTYEAGSFPILEAAAQGVPICCSDISVYREQAEIHGLRPTYFDPLEPESIAEALDELTRRRPHTDELKDIAQHVRRRTWRDVAQEYLRVFESVL